LLIVGAEITLCGGKGICIGLLSNIINWENVPFID
jgi:hypothetical protein